MKEENLKNTNKERPIFPKKAVITGGMPYGNKQLHFGHIGGVFIHADVYARFLRDRIGAENVIFVSGTDCYGSPIVEYYRNIKNKGEFEGTIEDFAKFNHQAQTKTLKDYDISLNFFGASAFGEAKIIHEKLSNEIFDKLYEKGFLEKSVSQQFYDEDLNVFLNGRQVVGDCPINNCKSETAYADECSLGHQYNPVDLINPKSTLTGKTPIFKEVVNWYFKLENFNELLQNYLSDIKDLPYTRQFLVSSIDEFLKLPIIYIKRNQISIYESIKDCLPKHTLFDEENKPSFTIEFEDLKNREKACEILTKNNVRYRTGKTLVPFRLTGNIEWGVKVDEKEGLDDLTFWVWPESLWAPISFTKTFIEINNINKDWKDFWCNKDAKVYQFIGEDNIYFYGPAEMALFMALNENAPTNNPENNQLQLPSLVPNKHVLFLGVKAGSSSAVKPPMANELLNFYTAEQLRCHFLALGLSNNSVSFQPKPFKENVSPKEADIVLKEGNLLTNVFNRLVRSCFYTSQKYYENKIPFGEVSEETIKLGNEAILEYEMLMYKLEFHSIMNVLDTFIRNANKHWAKYMKEAEVNLDEDLRKQTLVDALHNVRVCCLMLHPITPVGIEKVCESLNLSKNIFDWNNAFDDIYSFTENKYEHQIQDLPPRTDFFSKHPSQFE